MKAKKIIAAAVALALVAGSLAFAQERSAEEFDAEAREYKEYWFAAREKNKDNESDFILALIAFTRSHPKCIFPYLDIAEACSRAANPTSFSEDLGLDCFARAAMLRGSVPETEDGKLAKAKFHKAMALQNIRLFPENIKAGENEANAALEYNAEIGLGAFLDLARFSFFRNKNYAGCETFYKRAFDIDKDLSSLTGNDIATFETACRNAKKYADLAAFYDQYMNASQTCYFQDFGARAMFAYEKSKQKGKAVLVSMLDKEYTLSYNDSGADELIALLKKNFGKDKAASACINFVQKFYDNDAALEQKDLDSLPKNVRDFYPVRYMFQMKNSNDIAELKKDFDVFVGTSIGNFYIRLYEKAEKQGDKKTMAEIKALLKEKRYNEHGNNRLNK